MNILDFADYADLAISDTRKGQCPNCGKPKFYVTRKSDGYLYHCFRASCNLSGFAPADFTHLVSAKTTAKVSNLGNPYTGELSRLTELDALWFQDRFNVYPSLHSIRVAGHCHYALEIVGPRGEHKGWVIRKPWSGEPRCPRPALNDGKPKSMTYLEPGCTALSWHHADLPPDFTPYGWVIVEDQVSAMRLAEMGLDAIALLGCDISPQKLAEIARNTPRGETIVIALDPDATSKAFELARKVAHSLKVRVAILDYDPKDYPSDEQLWKDLKL